MDSIFELMSKLPAVVETAINCYAKNQQLFAVKDGMYCLQMTWYWWKQAETELVRSSQDDIVESTEELMIRAPGKSPTLISAKEQIEYMELELEKITEAAKDFISNSSLPPHIQYGLERGYDKAMEAMFNMQIAAVHNVELNRK